MAKALSTPKVVAVTGGAGYIGSRLVRYLAEQAEIERVVSLDHQAIAVGHPKVISLKQDILDPLERIFIEHRVDALVHLAFVMRQQRDREVSHHSNIDGTDNVLRAATAANVRKLVYLSSTTIYGALPDNLQPLTEESRARPSPNFHYAWDKREAERAFEEHQRNHPDSLVSVLRGSIVMGPNAANSITEALSKTFLIGVRGNDPDIQFTHDEDLVRLLWRFLSEGHPGTYNIAGPDTVRWSELGRTARKPILWLPAWLAYGLTNVAWHLHAQNDSTSAGLDYVRWPWVVSCQKLERDLGYQFKYTSAQALEAYLC